jgi:hypothetical protein
MLELHLINLLDSILADFSNMLNMKAWGLSVIYLITSIVLPIFYIKQINKYLNGTKGVGDLSFGAEIIQASLRLPALLYSISIANGPVFLSVLLDLIGRIAKLMVAKYVHDKFHLKFQDEK